MHTALFLLYFVKQQLQNCCLLSKEWFTENVIYTMICKKSRILLEVRKQVPLENRSVDDTLQKYDYTTKVKQTYQVIKILMRVGIKKKKEVLNLPDFAKKKFYRRVETTNKFRIDQVSKWLTAAHSANLGWWEPFDVGTESAELWRVTAAILSEVRFLVLREILICF